MEGSGAGNCVHSFLCWEVRRRTTQPTVLRFAIPLTGLHIQSLRVFTPRFKSLSVDFKVRPSVATNNKMYPTSQHYSPPSTSFPSQPNYAQQTIHPSVPGMRLNPTDSLTPVEVARVVCETGIRKAALRLDELMIKAVIGGCE